MRLMKTAGGCIYFHIPDEEKRRRIKALCDGKGIQAAEITGADVNRTVLELISGKTGTEPLQAERAAEPKPQGPEGRGDALQPELDPVRAGGDPEGRAHRHGRLRRGTGPENRKT